MDNIRSDMKPYKYFKIDIGKEVRCQFDRTIRIGSERCIKCKYWGGSIYNNKAQRTTVCKRTDPVPTINERCKNYLKMVRSSPRFKLLTFTLDGLTVDVVLYRKDTLPETLDDLISSYHLVNVIIEDLFVDNILSSDFRRRIKIISREKLEQLLGGGS